MMDKDWQEFEREILEIAEVSKIGLADPFDAMPPKDKVRDLEKIDKTLTTALQDLLPLQLEHHHQQDVLTAPFNWPVVQALQGGQFVLRCLRHDPLTLESDDPAYPSGLINSLREVRDAARKAIEMEKPGRGNDVRRKKSSARMAGLAKTFVFRYRVRFGCMPPMSKTGPTVDLLGRMLVGAGEDSNDAAEQLRRAIEKDDAGRQLLPSASAGKASKRAK